MARFSRNSRRTFKRKRATKWCARTVNGLVAGNNNLVTADAVSLCDTAQASIPDMQDVVLGNIRGQLSLFRLPASLLEDSLACAWAIVKMKMAPGGTIPVQLFDPFAQVDLERQDILGMGHIDIPPVLLQADNSVVTGGGCTVLDIDVKVGRKISRHSENLFLWIASTDNVGAGPDNSFHVIGSIRSLMKF